MTTRILALGICDNIERTMRPTGLYAPPRRDSFRLVVCAAIILAIVAVPVALAVAANYN